MKKLNLFVLALFVAALVPAVTLSAKDTAAKKEVKKESAALVDINSASEQDLQKLNGIGPAISAKIVAGRPYKGKDELVKKKILSKAAYAKIKDKIVAKQ